MSKYIETNSDGVIYVENEINEVFGIVSATQIIDEAGYPYDNLPIDILECKGFEIEQDFELEATVLILENAKVVFSNNDVTLDLF